MLSSFICVRVCSLYERVSTRSGVLGSIHVYGQCLCVGLNVFTDCMCLGVWLACRHLEKSVCVWFVLVGVCMWFGLSLCVCI